MQSQQTRCFSCWQLVYTGLTRTWRPALSRRRISISHFVVLDHAVIVVLEQDRVTVDVALVILVEHVIPVRLRVEYSGRSKSKMTNALGGQPMGEHSVRCEKVSISFSTNLDRVVVLFIVLEQQHLVRVDVDDTNCTKRTNSAVAEKQIRFSYLCDGFSAAPCTQ